MMQLKFERGSFPKKYRVYVFENDKLIKITQFGDQRYGQYRDKTPLKLYSSKDNLNDKRRVAYHKRHNYKKPLFTPGWFSANYLW